MTPGDKFGELARTLQSLQIVVVKSPAWDPRTRPRARIAWQARPRGRWCSLVDDTLHGAVERAWEHVHGRHDSRLEAGK